MDSGRPLFETLEFLDFELTLARRQLLRDGVPVTIGGRALDLLALLAAHPGEVLTNRLLMQTVWPRTIVEEVNLRVQIAALRKLIGGEGHCPYIVNYAGRGYCFTAPVTRRPALAVPVRGGWLGEGVFMAPGGARSDDTADASTAPLYWRDPGASM